MNYKAVVGLLCLAMLLGAAVLPASTAPQPNEAPVSWQIDIRYQTPQPILVKVPGHAAPQRFWYFRYTLTNRSGEDRDVAPEISLYTNTGQVVRAGRRVNPIVFQAIKTLHNSPLLNDTVGITGKMLQGEDNAKDGVAIFRDFDPKAASFTLFFGGLSGETAVVHLPQPITVTDVLATGKDKTMQTSTVTLSRTLALTYNLGAEAAGRTRADVRLVRKGWVMR